MTKLRSIIYVNYSPYENSGKILDYLLENFEYACLFSLGFYNIKKKGLHNKLAIYHNGKLEEEYQLFQLKVPQFLLFAMLPVRSVITLFQVIFYSHFLKQKLGKVDIFLSVNAFTSSIGILQKKLGIVSKTIFWVWDYYPPKHKDLIITFVRGIYWYFDRWATTYSDKVVFVNNRILNLRKEIGVVPKNANHPVIAIGTDRFKVKLENKKRVVLGFIGVVKRSMGLGVIFDSGEKIVQKFPSAKFEVIGSGPDESYFREKAQKSLLKTTFHGYLDGESFNDVLRKCAIGIAPYEPDPSNVSQYGDAGKVKRYLSLGLPVIITDIFEFSKEVEKNKAGVIIRYNDPNDLVKAIEKIMANYANYRKNALALGRKYYYKKIYPEMFKF